MVDRDGDITLRMLLTHTAGFGYPFFHEKMRDHGIALGETEESHTSQPLVRQPGTGFDYGVCTISHHPTAYEDFGGTFVVGAW